MVQSNDEALYNIEHKNNTQFKSDFQYLKNCLHLVEKTLTYMGKRLFNKLQVKCKNSINNNKLFKSSLTDF